MESHHSDNKNEEVSNDYSIYDNDSQGAIDELLNECKIMYKMVPKQKKQISSLEEKIDTMKTYFEVEKQNFVKEQKLNFVCKECESLSFQIVQFKRVLKRYEKWQFGLDGVLSQQRYSNDESGLGYSKFNKTSSSETIFVKASDHPIRKKWKKTNKVHHYHKRKRFVKKKILCS